MYVKYYDHSAVHAHQKAEQKRAIKKRVINALYVLTILSIFAIYYIEVWVIAG